jgi:hypothetical protein
MKEKLFRYMLYLQRNNGYWEREPYETLEEIQYVLDAIDDEEYWWYLVIEKDKTKGDQTICGGKVHTKEEYKARKKGR